MDRNARDGYRRVSVLALLVASPASGDSLNETARLGIAAIELAGSIASDIWPGLAELDAGFVVIDGDREVAVCFDAAPGFAALADTPAPGCRAFSRPRVFPPRMQASLNIFGSEETVLVASPESLGQNVLEWQTLFVHERFHQWQSTHPRYGERIAALDLDGGDTSGLWMLTYAFPYDEPALAAAFRQLGQQLASLHSEPDPAVQADLAAGYVATRRHVFAQLAPADRRYAEFQLWKEGAARYTEIAFARRASERGGAQADEFRQLAESLYTREQGRLRQLDTKTSRRGVFYTLGAFEWLLADRVSPGWRERYAEAGPLAVAPVLDSARSGSAD